MKEQVEFNAINLTGIISLLMVLSVSMLICVLKRRESFREEWRNNTGTNHPGASTNGTKVITAKEFKTHFKRISWTDSQMPENMPHDEFSAYGSPRQIFLHKSGGVQSLDTLPDRQSRVGKIISRGGSLFSNAVNALRSAKAIRRKRKKLSSISFPASRPSGQAGGVLKSADSFGLLRMESSLELQGCSRQKIMEIPDELVPTEGKRHLIVSVMPSMRAVSTSPQPALSL